MKDIIGHGGGGDSHTHYEAKDSLHNTAYARVLDLVSEGEILGLANGLASVYLNQTPVENADGTKNFSNVTVDFRTGTQSQDYIPGFPDVENEISIGVELKSGTPWVRAISNTSLSAIRVTLGVPMLTKQDTNNGDVLGYKIDYKIELSTDGGAYSTVLASSFNGKTTSEYRRSARIDLPTATTGWQIRVTRLTANANTASIADTTNIVSYTEVIDAKLRYPMSAIVGIQVDASQFQNVPTRAYELYGRIIQVPSNYDAMARTYTGTWDGTFKPSWSNNPAWVFRDLVLNDRYGLGHRISAAQVDKWELYKIARYCDELVPNGKGGTEPRFTCNLYLQSRKQAYAVLQDLASIFRGISYWGAGSIFASADMPADPVYVYTAANVIGGKFTRTGSKKSTRYTVALITWNDPADFYKPKVEYVEDAEGIARYGIQQVELTAFGCTSQGQAQRAGRWALATSRLETEGITFDVGMDGAIARPGQIVRVADPSRMGRRVGGRVRTASGRTVTLDKAPTVKAGDRLTVVLPTGASETHTVASVAGDAVTVDADWSTLPAAQFVWSVDSDELSAPLCRVLSVAEKDEVTFTITAVQHEPGKYDFVENGTAITPRTQTSLDVTKQAPPASVTLAGYTVSLNDVQKLALQVSCAPVAGAVAYEGAYKRDDGNWVAIPRQPSPTMDVTDVLPGSYMAKMSAVNAIGVTSVETLSVAVALAKDGASKNAAVLLAADAPAFHTNQAGATDPTAITFTASLIALDGPVVWSCVGGTLTNKAATTAQLTFANMSAAAATITASVTSFGRTYSQSFKVTKIQDGAAGTDGLKTGVARLYQWASTAPAKPAGSSTFTWATVSNGTYIGSDGWATAVPANPGTPGVRLYVASVSLSAAAAATTSTASYTSATVEAWSQNGANGTNGTNGTNGANGVQSALATVYQWAATIPAGPVGSATFTWSNSTFGAAPTGWALTPGTSPSAGMTLWAARVQVTDSAANSTTAFNWTGASITVAGYAGTNGANGAASYTWIKYADSTSGAGLSDDPTGKAYIGLAYNKTTATESTVASDYTWSLIKGADGAAGPKGADGTTTYTWIKYSDNSDGTGLYDVPTASTAYIGIAVNKTTATESTVKTDYVWSKFKGDQGVPGPAVYTWVKYADTSAGAGLSDDPTGKTYIGFAYNKTTATESTVATDYTWSLIKGTDGVQGPKGADGSSLYTWIKYSDNADGTGLYDVPTASTLYIGIAVNKATATESTLKTDYAWSKFKGDQGVQGPTGAAGQTGQTGASYVTAYCASSSVSATGVPAPTTGKTSLPAANSAGINGTWSATVPTLASDQYMYQSDGLYDPATNQVTWSTPYWSSLKVGSLSTVHHNTGDLTVTGTVADGAGNWSIDSGGNMTAKKFTLIDAATGATILTAGGIFNPAYIPMTGPTLVRQDFSYAGLTDWTNQRTGSPSTVPTVTGATLVTNDADFGTCGEFTTIDVAGENVLPKGVVDVVPGRVYKITATFKCVTLPDGPADWGLAIVGLDATYALTAQFLGLGLVTVSTAGQVYTVSYYASTSTGTGVQQLSAGTRYLRAGLRLSTNETTAPTMRLKSVRIEDATDSYNAQQTANTANSGLAGKLNAGAASTLTGAMTVSATGGISIGTLTWNASGGRTGGYGVGITSSGIAAYNSAGLPTFVLDATTGKATFYDTLSGASGSLGSVHLYSGGIHGGAYSSYAWVASGQVGFYLGPEGLKLGCLADNKYFNVDQFGNMWAPGFTIVDGVLTLTSAVMNNPKVSTAFSVSLADIYVTGQVNGSTITVNSSPTVAGGTISKYVWSFTPSGPSSSMGMTSSPSASVAAIQTSGSNVWRYGYLSLTAYSTDGATATATCYIQIQFGSAQQA